MVKFKFLFSRCSFALLLHICLQANGQCPMPAEMLNQLTFIESNDADTFEKIKQIQQLQKLYLKCNKTKDSVFARIIHKLGSFFSMSGNIEKAISFTKEAISINAAANDKSEKQFLANSYFNLNNYYDILYLREECYKYLDSCIAISTQFPDKYFIAFMAFERKAFNLFQTGDYQKSIETADKGIFLQAV